MNITYIFLWTARLTASRFVVCQLAPLKKPTKVDSIQTSPCDKKRQSAGRRLPSDPGMGSKRLFITGACLDDVGPQQPAL
ncbi:MAG: hypothetical protein ACI9O6_002702 [Glaciecola sp.]|jgi:hypothetical protein